MALMALIVMCAQFAVAQKKVAPAGAAKEDLSMFPAPAAGYKQVIVRVPALPNEQDAKIELIIGKTAVVDKCNKHFLTGNVTTKNLDGWGYNYYHVTTDGNVAGTLMACSDTRTEKKFVALQPELTNYNSRLPVVIYLPQDCEVRYRIWKAGKQVLKAGTAKPAAALIRDCPEEMIVNKMPMISQDGKAKQQNTYYIYKGERKEIADFDAAWLKKHCRIKVSEVH